MLRFDQWLLLCNRLYEHAGDAFYFLIELSSSYTEPESNSMTEKLAKWIKTNNRQPILNRPLLGGSPIGTDANRIGYNVDVDENILANFLKNRRDAKALGVNYYESDDEILANYGLDNLFGVPKKLSYEEKALKRLRQIDAFRKKYNKMPYERGSLSIEAEGETVSEKTLGEKLLIWKQAYKNKKPGNAIYPSVILLAQELEFPDDWLYSKNRDEEASITNMKMLIAFYEKYKFLPAPSGGGYVDFEGKNITEKFLGAYLSRLRGIFKNTRRGILYDSVLKLGNQFLPEGWIESRDYTPESLEKYALEKVAIIAGFYHHFGRLPKTNGLDIFKYENPETGEIVDYKEAEISVMLHTLRSAKEGRHNRVHYPKVDEEGARLKLPEGWIDRQHKKNKRKH